MSREWEKQIPHIEDGNVRWAVLYVHNIEEYEDFEHWAEEVRETCLKNPERRETYEEAYRYLVEHTPPAGYWYESTGHGQSFCTRAELHEYLQAYYDYVFGDRPEPIMPPSNEEPCEHEHENGRCVLAIVDRAQEENG